MRFGRPRGHRGPVVRSGCHRAGTARGLHDGSGLRPAESGRTVVVPLHAQRCCRNREHRVVEAIRRPGTRRPDRGRARAQPQREGRRRQCRTGAGGDHADPLGAVSPGRLLGERREGAHSRHGGRRRDSELSESADDLPDAADGKLGDRPVGPHPASVRGGAGQHARHRRGAPRRDPHARLVGRDQLHHAARPGRAARDREAHARHVRGIGAPVPAAVQVRADLADDRGAGAVSIRDRCGADSADRGADRPDRERPLDPARSQPGPHPARQIDLRPRAAGGPGGHALRAARAPARPHAVRAGADCGQRADRCRQGALFPDHLAHRRARQLERGSVEPLHGADPRVELRRPDRRADLHVRRGQRSGGAVRSRTAGSPAQLSALDPERIRRRRQRARGQPEAQGTACGAGAPRRGTQGLRAPGEAAVRRRLHALLDRAAGRAVAVSRRTHPRRGTRVGLHLGRQHLQGDGRRLGDGGRQDDDRQSPSFRRGRCGSLFPTAALP